MPKFKVKIKIKDSRKKTVQQKSATHAYDSPVAKAVRHGRSDYRPPIHGRRKK